MGSQLPTIQNWPNHLLMRLQEHAPCVGKTLCEDTEQIQLVDLRGRKFRFRINKRNFLPYFVKKRNRTLINFV